MSTRKALPHATSVAVLTEAGYRCAVPTCRTILALDLHHILEVSEGGGNELANLIALCPTCHALFHRGTIARDSIYAWKGMLVGLSHAFDLDAIDQLLFLAQPQAADLRVTGDGVIQFSRLVAAGLVDYSVWVSNVATVLYAVTLTGRGKLLVHAWQSGNRAALTDVLSGT